MTIHHAFEWASAGRLLIVGLVLLLTARGLFGPFGRNLS